MIGAVNRSQANWDTQNVSFPWGMSSSHQAPSGQPGTAVSAVRSALPVLGIIPSRAPRGTVSTLFELCSEFETHRVKT